MHAVILMCINQRTTFELPSSTDSNDMIGAKFKKGHVILTTPL